MRLERLESRICLAAETYLINFQLDSSETPTRYFADAGELFGARPSSQVYGWSSDHTDVSRQRGNEPDGRLDTLVHFHQFQSWEFQLDNGVYEVTASIGDASYGSIHTLNVEGTNYWNQLSLDAGDFRQATAIVTVTDGRLTLDQGNAVEMATRVNYVQIVNLPANANGAPLAPTILEPAIGELDVNPTDVHMEAGGYLDPTEGDGHYSSDWEIWTAGGQRVWQTLGIRGVERRHTHLADGIFENSHAGRTELFGDSDYELRVRFRDAAGSTSSYATRTFSTGAAVVVYPLEVQDVAAAPAPTWGLADAGPVILPAYSVSASQLRLDALAGNLLSIVALDGTSNTVANPAPLADHQPIRLTLTAGDTGLILGESDLTFFDETSIQHTIYLPAVTMVPGSSLVFWINDVGSSYYGDVTQTEPDFSNLARSLPVPFVATQPDYVVDSFAEGFQLPVNIAFVPNPTTNPTDPLMYVAELYGNVKVIANNGNVSNYATGLLNFNPTGNFPGSGEQGLAGLVVDPQTGDVIVTRVTSEIPFDDLSPHHPQVVRLSSTDGGLTASNETVLLDMPGETQGQSHQISNVSFGPDGQLYVHNGDGFDASVAQNLNSFRGKVLRMKPNGRVAEDNPFFNAADGITAADYVFAYGFRNPFGGAWRASDGQHYEVENGPSIDRFAKVEEGENYLWNGSNSSMLNRSIYNWNPAHAPVNITFVQPATFGGSQFPASAMDLAFVSESGPTYASGPQDRGKRIVTFELDANGDLVSGPTPFVEYVGTGRATVVGLAAGPDGLYFTDFYKDLDAQSPIDAGSRLLRVRYVGQVDGDFNNDGVYDCGDADQLVGAIAAQTNSSAFDLTSDGLVDIADLDAWRAEAGTANLGAGRTYLPGDADLDGTVDGDDFQVWNSFKFTSNSGWCGADFNADGFTDGADFLIWNGSKFQTSDVASRESWAEPELRQTEPAKATAVNSAQRAESALLPSTKYQPRWLTRDADNMISSPRESTQVAAEVIEHDLEWSQKQTDQIRERA